MTDVWWSGGAREPPEPTQPPEPLPPVHGACTQRATVTSARGAIHQFVPSFAGRDAIGRHTLAARNLLRKAGFDSEIFAGESLREVAKQSSAYQRFDPVGGQPTWLLYQCSTGSPVGDFVMARTEPLIVDYHNITPAEMFEAWEPHVGVELVAGRAQLAELARRAVLGLADSTYNAAELSSLGCARTAVAPILLDTSEFHQDPDPARLAQLATTAERGGSDWLFVGRLAPNKAQHHLVAALAFTVANIDSLARLHLVGGSSSHRYEQALRAYVAELGLTDHVEFALSVSHTELLAYYAGADVFVCLSDHEGFCVPLVEAMELSVPVVAFASSAVPETLAGGGLLLPDKTPAVVAGAVQRVLADTPLRQGLVAAGRRRARELSLVNTEVAFMDSIESLVAGR
jgi:glycosyltransferase involved in cell wall biosynthesis